MRFFKSLKRSFCYYKKTKRTNLIYTTRNNIGANGHMLIGRKRKKIHQNKRLARTNANCIRRELRKH